MTAERIELVKLTASDGMVLTNGEAFGTTVYIGVNDNAENWYEITAEEAEKLQQNQEDEESNESGENV